MLSDQDQEIYREALQEIDELIEVIIAEYLKIEQPPYKQDVVEASTREIMRNMHSIKGALGMIGHEEQMNSVHHAESFLSESYKVTKYSHGVIEIMIEYWSRLQESLKQESKSSKSISPFHGCFNCVKEHKYQTVCSGHNKSEVKCVDKEQAVVVSVLPVKESGRFATISQAHQGLEILVIGDNPKLLETLDKNTKLYCKLHCINEIYLRIPLAQLKKVHTIFLDVASLKVNPFLLQPVLSQLNLKVKTCFLIQDKEELSKFLNDVPSVNSFCVISLDSPYLEKEILSLV